MRPNRGIAEHRDRGRDSAFLVVILALAITGCGGTPTPSRLIDPAVSSHSTGDTSTAPSNAVATPGPRCPAFAFDPAASLGPEFDNEYFERGESDQMTEQFLDAMEQIYAGTDDVDLCRWFTDGGLRTALETDQRLRDVLGGALVIEADLLLRLASEGTYDLRTKPPTDPVDAIFDIAAGATVTDLRSGAKTTTRSDERVGLHIDFAYDGHQWRVDHVGPVSDENDQFVTLPQPVPPGAPCPDFQRDRGTKPFDESAVDGHRTWCDADGGGREISALQLDLFTRYPCNTGHAAVLIIGHPLGLRIDPLVRHEFVRDPAGEFLEAGWVIEPYQADATLPDDAAYTGWTNGNIELWISPGEFARAIYVKRGDVIERWPRAADEWGVIDCN